MHVILATMGTDGDVFPFVGLGAKLRARGHRVTLAANEHYRALASRQDLDFRSLVSDAETHALMGNPDVWHPIKSALVGARWAGPLMERQYAVLAELARGESSVLVAYPPMFAARLVHETHSRPLASLVVMPWMIPSLCAPPALPKAFNLPERAPVSIVRVYWRFLETAADFLIGRQVNHLRRSLGLRAIRGVVRWAYSPDLTIGLFSEKYAPAQPDWPRGTQLTGFPLFDGERDGKVPDDLLAFCQAGTPPVAFTFGTGNMHAHRFFQAAAEACARLGVRGIFLTRYREQLPDALPSFVRHCSFAPFQKLFPFCAAAVHHGGMGTTSQALAAGVPQLILPLAWDQPDNAARVRRLGAGLALSSHSTATALAKGIAEILRPEFHARCRSLADRFGKGDGLDTAARLVEACAVS